MKNSSFKVALFGHRLDSSNLGVDALTHSHLALLDEIATQLNVHFDVDIFAGHSALPMLTVGQNLRVSQFANPILPKRFISNCFNLPKKFRQYVAIFDLSEGDSFSDIYGWRRAYINSMQKILADRSGIPVIVAPMTIGPD